MKKPTRTRTARPLAAFFVAALLLGSAAGLRGQPAGDAGFEESYRFVGRQQGMPEQAIRALAEGFHGEIYLGTDEGLWRWDGRRGKRMPLPRAAYTCLHRGDDGALYGTANDTLFRYDGVLFTKKATATHPCLRHPPRPGPGDTAAPGSQDRHTIPPPRDTAAPGSQGLHTTPLPRDTAAPGPGSAPAAQPRLDVGAHSYSGTGEGLLIRHRSGWEKLVTPGCDNPWSVTPGENGGIILACHYRQLQSYDSSGRYLGSYSLPTAGLSPGEMQLFPGYLAEGPGRSYLGGFMGVYRLRDGRVSFFRMSGRDGSSTVEAFARDPRSGDILAAGRHISVFAADGSLRRDSIAVPAAVVGSHSATDILLTDAALWVSGKAGIGAYDRSTRRWRIYSPADSSLPTASPYHLFRTPQGRLFAGLPDGLAVLDSSGSRFARLFPDMIRQQVSEILHIGGDTLAVVEARRCYFFREKASGLELLRVFDEANGLMLLEMNENGALLHSDGRLYLPDFEGVSRFVPARLRGRSADSLRLVITALGDSLLPLAGPGGSDSPLVFGSRDLSVEYFLTGEMAGVARLQYRDGEGRWQDAGGTEGRASLHMLPPGLQRLQLRAYLPGVGEESLPVFTKNIRVALPYAAHPFFMKIILVMLALGMLIVAYFLWEGRFEARQMRRLNRMLLDARNRAIEAQLNPGFIERAMGAIRDDIRGGDRRGATRKLVHLARTLRRILDLTSHDEREGPRPAPEGLRARGEAGSVGLDGGDTNPLDSELSLLRDLVLIEEERRPGAFAFRLDVDPATREDNPPVPTLIVAPPVNWLLSGDPEEGPPVALLMLTVRMADDRLELLYEAFPEAGRRFRPDTHDFAASPEGRAFFERLRLMEAKGVPVAGEQVLDGRSLRVFVSFPV